MSDKSYERLSAFGSYGSLLPWIAYFGVLLLNLPWYVTYLGLLPSLLFGIYVLGNRSLASFNLVVVAFLHLVPAGLFGALALGDSGIAPLQSAGTILLFVTVGGSVLVAVLVGVRGEKLVLNFAERDPANRETVRWIRMLKQNDHPTRIEAVRNLGRLKNSLAVVPLSKIVTDTWDDADLRVMAAQAIGAIGGEEAVKTLDGLLEDKALTGGDAATSEQAVLREAIARALDHATLQ
ncbi:MAG TPA: HEAT repeat domain-containing protein [Chloroflexia bacterium]|jgi:hypothetical protein